MEIELLKEMLAAQRELIELQKKQLEQNQNNFRQLDEKIDKVIVWLEDIWKVA